MSVRSRPLNRLLFIKPRPLLHTMLGPGLQEEPHDLCVPVLRGRIQGRQLFAARASRVRAETQEQLDYLQVAALRGQDERDIPCICPSVQEMFSLVGLFVATYKVSGEIEPSRLAAPGKLVKVLTDF